jgi:hypothetical protein
VDVAEDRLREEGESLRGPVGEAGVEVGVDVVGVEGGGGGAEGDGAGVHCGVGGVHEGGEGVEGALTEGALAEGALGARGGEGVRVRVCVGVRVGE